MRAMNAEALALLASVAAGDRVSIVQLVELRFPTVLYLTTAGGPIDWDGETWTPAGLGAIEAIEDSADELLQLRFTLPGLNEQQIAVALEPAEGTVVVVYDGWLDPATGECVHAERVWKGTMNVPTLVDGGQADLTVTAEHQGMLALRPKPSRYTNDEQQRLYPGDTSLDFDPKTDAGPFPWPAASFFKA